MKYTISILIIGILLNTNLIRSQSVSGIPDKSCVRAKNLLSKYRYNEALNIFKKCNKSPNTINNIAFCYFKLGNFTKAKAYYKKSEETDSTNILSLNKLATIYTNESNYRESIKYYHKILRIDSTNSYYYSQLGNLYKRAENIPLSIEYYNKALELNPENILVLDELARFYMKLGLLNKADNLINVGISIDSTNLRLLISKSKILYRQQKYDTTIIVINHILDISKDTSSLMLRLLATSNFNMKKYNKAIELLEKIVTQGEESEVIYYFLGKSYLEIKEPEKSIAYFNKALKEGISENVSTYFINIAYLQEEKGKYINAVKAYKDAYYYTKDKIILYKIAKNYNLAYKDKEPALKYYKKYLKQRDLDNKELIKYTKIRIIAINEIKHFKTNN